MAHKLTYWVSTGVLVALSVLAAFTYLSGSAQAVQGFAHVGYPQQLGIILGIVKLLVRSPSPSRACIRSRT